MINKGTVKCDTAGDVISGIRRAVEMGAGVTIAPDKSVVLLTEIDRLTAENAALREAARWIPTNERIPAINETVLILVGGKAAWAYWDMEQEGDWETGYKKYRMWYFIAQDNDEYEPYIEGEPEFWQPLPPAPDVTNPVTDEEKSN